MTFAEYVSRMKEGQTCIYYACGQSVEKIEKLPQTELVRDKGYEILYLTEDVDEFALKVLHDLDGKEFKSVSAGDLDLDTPEEKEEEQKQQEENKDLFAFMTEALDGKVQTVRLSRRLKTHPVCLASAGELSLEMEKVLNAMPTDNKVKAERVLEVNESHPIFATLTALYETDKEKLKTYSQLLYAQALPHRGDVRLEDPVEFSNQICGLMRSRNKRNRALLCGKSARRRVGGRFCLEKTEKMQKYRLTFRGKPPIIYYAVQKDSLCARSSVG